MNVRCSHCQTVYRIDPRKVPERGVRARCSVCRGVFAVAAAGSEAARASAPAAATVVAAPAAGAPGASSAGFVAAPPPASPTPAAAEGAPLPAASAPASAASAATGADPAGGASRGFAPRFGGQDPHARARRLARALVSDMVIYHPERQERGLRQGTLRQEFREEIKKSWEEYVEQVGREVAHSTPYFRDALNEILARGAQVF